MLGVRPGIERRLSTTRRGAGCVVGVECMGCGVPVGRWGRGGEGAVERERWRGSGGEGAVERERWRGSGEVDVEEGWSVHPDMGDCLSGLC